MKKTTFLLTLIIFLWTDNSFAQGYESLTNEDFANHPYWIEMMADESVNFYDVQQAFELYWQNRKITKGSGWKPFKRWEYLMSSRIFADGTRFPADLNWREYFAYKQSHPKSDRYAGNWQNPGPYQIPGSKGYNGLGRLNAIGFHPADPNTIFVGAPSGGLWVTHDNGQSWYSETDILPTLGVSAIVVDFVNPDVILIGSGDRDAGDAPGMGVMRSTDGGLTWELSNDGMGNKVVGRLTMHPQDNQIILAATNGGIYKSTDNGQTWVSKQIGNFKEIVFKPDNPEIVYASANGRFYRSTDSGESFQMITSGLSSGARGVIGVSPANPETVYFLLTISDAFLGLYRSDDAGLSFIEQSDSPNIMSWGCEGGDGGQAWYDLDIAVDPQNENVIFAGGVNCFKSSDGGVTWEISSHWWGDCGVPSVHADLHVLEYNPHDGRLFAGNDGGIYWTADQGTTWVEISDGLAISQAYKIGQSATVSDLVINGYQDNGTATWIGTPDWIPVIGGDGMECAIDYQNAVYSYGTLYYGEIFRITNNANSTIIAKEGHFGINESGAWVTPFLLHKSDPNKMFVGYKNVWRGQDIRTSIPVWQKISSDLGGSNGVNMRCIEQSPVNLEILYAAREDRKLFRSDNANKQAPTWTNLSIFLPENLSINDLEAHPYDENIIYMAQGTKVYKSIDKGLTWENISGSLPSVSVNSIAYSKNSHEGLYVGTDIGVFYNDLFLVDWILFGDGFPASARVTEVEIYHDSENPENDMIRAGTYGRGLWESDLYYDTLNAAFEADKTLIPPLCPVNFTDLSAGIPTSWEWEFEGGIPDYSNLRNPEGIVYNEPGTYKVTLLVSNKAGTSEVAMEDYITVSDELLPVPDFTVNQTAVCSNEVVHFIDESSYCPSSYSWSFIPDNVIYYEGTSSSSPEPIVLFAEPGDYTVSLTVENSNGSASLTKENYIHNGGLRMPYNESFEDGFTSKGWMIENPDTRKTWEIAQPTYAPDGNYAAFMNNFDYYLMFERDRLISPPINLEGITEAHLNFKHAYAQRYQQVDSLLVKISTNCGTNWETIYANGPDGAGVFETSPPTADYFDPLSAEDWCGQGYGAECTSLDITPFCNQPNVKIMFEAFNRIGNNLYIDEVEISVLTDVKENQIAKDGFDIIPNPSDGSFMLLCHEADSEVKISVIDPGGIIINKKYLNQLNQGESLELNLGSISKGIYIITMTGLKNTVSKKLIIK